MELGDQRPSDNVEDRRGIGLGAGGLGVGGVVIAVIAYFLGFDPTTAVQTAEQLAVKCKIPTISGEVTSSGLMSLTATSRCRCSS